MMHNKPAKDKPLIDLTLMSDNMRIQLLEQRIAQLEDQITILTMRIK